MDCAYLKSSDTNISDYFDSSKSYCIFLNNRVKVPLKSDFSFGVYHKKENEPKSPFPVKVNSLLYSVTGRIVYPTYRCWLPPFGAPLLKSLLK